MEIKVKYEISENDIASLLISAFEGGSNYWYMIEKFIKPKNWDYHEKEHEDNNSKHYPHEYCLNEGGALLIGDIEKVDKKKYRLNLRSIKKGLEVMADKFPNHFNDIIEQDADATTGDVFLQCCLFEDVIYG